MPKKRKTKNNRALHKKIALHPISIFLFLVTGLILIVSSFSSSALELAITAKIPAPAITSPAQMQIVYPTADIGQQRSTSGTSSDSPIAFTSKQVVISGECPKSSHIEIYRNNSLAGVTPCIGDPTFSIQIDLEEGLNIIIARVFNITEDEGPVSSTLYLRYTPPATDSENQSAGTKQETKTTKTQPQFLLFSDFKSLGFYTNTEASWRVTIKNGKPPYKFVVTWGDGQKSEFTQNNNDDVILKHVYQRATNYEGYVITVTSTDANGSVATYSFMTVISDPNSATSNLVNIANHKKNPDIFTQIYRWLGIAWPVYCVLALMLASFWLGEREEDKKFGIKFRRKK